MVAREEGFGYDIGVGPVLIVKTGTTVPGVLERRGDYEQWFTAGMGLSDRQVSLCRVDQDEEQGQLPDPSGLGVTHREIGVIA